MRKRQCWLMFFFPISFVTADMDRETHEYIFLITFSIWKCTKSSHNNNKNVRQNNCQLKRSGNLGNLYHLFLVSIHKWAQALKKIELPFFDKCWVKWNRNDIAMYLSKRTQFNQQCIKIFDWWNLIQISVFFPSKSPTIVHKLQYTIALLSLWNPNRINRRGLKKWSETIAFGGDGNGNGNGIATEHQTHWFIHLFKSI